MVRRVVCDGPALLGGQIMKDYKDEIDKLYSKLHTIAGSLVSAVDILLQTEGNKLEMDTRVWLRRLINQYKETDQAILDAMSADLADAGN